MRPQELLAMREYVMSTALTLLVLAAVTDRYKLKFFIITVAEGKISKL